MALFTVRDASIRVSRYGFIATATGSIAIALRAIAGGEGEFTLGTRIVANYTSRPSGCKGLSSGKGKTMSKNESVDAASMHPIVITPIERPIVIDAIRCRLRQDIEDFGVSHSIPTAELRLILDIVDAARHCVKEWEPNATEKARGAGTGVGMRAAEDKLIRVLKGDMRRS